MGRTARGDNPIILNNIAWKTYEALLQDIAEHAGVRLTCDRGKLETIAPLDPYETYAELMGRFVATLTEELEIEIRNLGLRTCKREDLSRGLEPDKYYYIQNKARVRHLDKIDLNQDPPSD